MRSVLTTFLSAAALLPLVAAATLAQPASSASFRLEYQDINAAGGRATSASFALTDCVGSAPEATGKSSSASFVLYAACAAAIPAFLPSDDDDGDGVTNGVENGAPNGGDGNDDGIPDETQGNVASIPSAGRNGYETLVACVDAGCTMPCQARQVTAIAQDDLPQPGQFNFPAGLLGFVLDCSQANVHILYHGFDQFPPNTVYEKFGPNPPGSATSIYYALPGVVFGSEAVGSDPAVASANFVLTDGAVGDATPVDGTIVDPGGPAFETASPAPALSPKALAAALLILTLSAFVAMRRRRSDGGPRS
jgi:hypothetical protein